MRRAQGRDPAALHELVVRYADALLSTAAYLLGSEADAQEVTQETLLAMVSSIRQFQFRSSFRTWLWAILIRLAQQRLRERHRRRGESAAAEFPGSAAADPRDGIDVRLDVADAMMHLNAEHREVLVLREMEGMSYEQIAVVLEVPRGTVESRLHRARQAMRTLLSDYASREV